jgi:hypothetical protein
LLRWYELQDVPTTWYHEPSQIAEMCTNVCILATKLHLGRDYVLFYICNFIWIWNVGLLLVKKLEDIEMGRKALEQWFRPDVH